MRWAIGFLTAYLLTLGVFMGLGMRQDRIESERRCEAFVRGFELLGDELAAPPERIEAFTTRLRDETDC